MNITGLEEKKQALKRIALAQFLSDSFGQMAKILAMQYIQAASPQGEGTNATNERNPAGNLTSRIIIRPTQIIAPPSAIQKEAAPVQHNQPLAPSAMVLPPMIPELPRPAISLLQPSASANDNVNPEPNTEPHEEEIDDEDQNPKMGRSSKLIKRTGKPQKIQKLEQSQRVAAADLAPCGSAKLSRKDANISAKTILKNHTRHANRFIASEACRKHVEAALVSKGLKWEEFEAFVMKVNKGLKKYDFVTVNNLWSGEKFDIDDHSFDNVEELKAAFPDEKRKDLAEIYKKTIKLYFKRFAAQRCYSSRVKKARIGMISAVHHILRSLRENNLAFHKLLITNSDFIRELQKQDNMNAS